jgi:hypothetical protein
VRRQVRVGGFFVVLVLAILAAAPAAVGSETAAREGVGVPRVLGPNLRISGPDASGYPAGETAVAVAYNSVTGGYLVVWPDMRSSSRTVYGRLVSASGSPVGADFLIGSLAFNPAVAFDSITNQFLVVWADNWTTSRYDIYGQRVSAAGALVGGALRISGAAATYGVGQPAAAFDSTTGEFLVVWRDGRNWGDRGQDIYGQRVSAAGTAVGSNFRISGTAAVADDSEPTVAYGSTADEFLVAWEDARDLSTRQHDIYGRRVSGSGSPVGGDFRICGRRAVAFDMSPAAAYDPTTDQFLVVWEDMRKSATRGLDIRGRWLSAEGFPVGPDFRISGRSAIKDDSDPTVTYNSAADQLLVAWSDYRDWERGYDIYGQRVSTSDATVGNNFRISDDTATKDEHGPAAAYDSATNHYLVVWADLRDTVQWDNGEQIYGQRLAG